MQLILIQPNELLKDLISLNIKTFLSIDVINRADAKEAIDLISILPEIDLIITTTSNGHENTAYEIAKYITEQELDIPLLVLGDLPQLEGIESFSKSIQETNWEEAITCSAQILGIDEDVLKQKKKPVFAPVSLTYFMNIEQSPCDIYIRIKKSDEDFQFVKRIHQGDSFSKDIIQKYEVQGLKNFYVPKDQLDILTTYISNELCKKLNDPVADIANKIDLMATSHNFMANEITKIGFTSSTVQLSETLVQNIVDIFEKEKELSNLVVKVLTSKSSYIYQHTHLTTIVACQILNNLKMTQKSDQEKMAFAALFKDIMLIEDQELAKISTLEELELYTKDDEVKWELVYTHALKAAVLVRGYTQAPLDVDNIIKHHHATMSGRGFGTSSCNEDFDIHSLVFMISIEFVNELLQIKEKNKAPKPLIEELRKKFRSPKAKTVIEALAQTIINTKES